MSVLKVGITGGIGSGKSVVCRMFELLGVPVYYSDIRARELMESDRQLVEGIKELFGEDSYSGGKLDRACISAKVFGDRTLLLKLDSLVHPAVMRDFDTWVACRGDAAGESDIECPESCNDGLPHHGKQRYVIMESALIFDAGLADRFCRVITVSAPVELRTERVMRRNNLPREEVERRIAAQMSDSQRESLADFVIHNDETTLVWEQVLDIDRTVAQLEN